MFTFVLIFLLLDVIYELNMWLIRWQLWWNNRRDFFSLSKIFSANLIINFSIYYISLNLEKILSFRRINYLPREEKKLSSKKNLESMRTHRSLSLPRSMKGKRENRSWVIPGIGSQVERDDSNPPEGRTIIPDQTQSRLSLDEAEARGPGDPEHASTSGRILDVQSSGKRRLRGASMTRRSDVKRSGEERERGEP